MGYKDMVLGQLTQTAIDERDNVYFKMAQEVEEVYRKAKAWEQFKNDYHTEITQAIDNLFKLNNMDIAGETIFLLEKILNDMTEDKQND